LQSNKQIQAMSVVIMWCSGWWPSSEPILIEVGIR